MVGYDAFVPGTTTLKDWYSAAQHMQDIWLYTQLAAWTGWSFGIMAATGIIAMLLQRRMWKKNAWMVMILIFLLLLLPAQGWLITQDVELWNHVSTVSLSTATVNDPLTGIFVQRMTGMVFSVVNGLLLLMGISIVATLAIRPLTLND